MTLLSLKNLSVRRAGAPVLDGINLTLGKGEFVGLIGPNGAGKTTLLRAALGLLRHEGRSSLAEMPLAARARQAAFMPQGREIAWRVTVEDLIMLGRPPHAQSPEVAAQAIAALELEPLRHRPATELSGGEQARALIARMLAQDAPLMIADEPIAGLDPAAQIKVMRVFAGLAARGHTVLASLHDLGLAARHCSRLILLDQGRIAADGPPTEVLSPEDLAQTFGISAYFAMTPEGPIFQPLGILGREARGE